MSVTLARTEPSIAGAGDYIALMKPRVMSLVVFTALVGLLVAPGHIHPVIGFTALLCIAVGAGAAGALNMWYDADIDARMAAPPAGRSRAAASRRARRPASASRSRRSRWWCSASWSTCWPRRCSPSRSSFTSRLYDVAEALDAAEHRHRRRRGRVAADDRLGGGDRQLAIEPIVLFLIIFFWTPPHFWALSLYRIGDYARAGVPMLPVVAGEARRAARFWLYTLLLAPLGVAPWLLGYTGSIYGVAALVLGAGMLVLALRVRRESRAATRRASNCSLSRSSICFCCSPCCWSIGCREGCSAISRHDVGE